MATLSPMRKAVPILSGLPLIHQGKVRDSYQLVGNKRLPYVTDGISIFDFVLNALVPGKGPVLNAMSHFWFKHFEARGIKTHMLAAGSGIDAYLPEYRHGDIDLQSRGMVVRDLRIPPIEFIARNYLTGSVLEEYQNSGTVYGQLLPPDLQDGDELKMPIFTPTTKAEDGHDEEVDAEQIRKENKEAVGLFLHAFAEVTWFAKQRGILLADSKGELGYDTDGILRIGDEFGTPDSSRFWDARVHVESRRETVRKAPPPFDKQLVRAWGISMGINDLDPKNPEHVKRVHGMEVPKDLIEATAATYREIFRRLTDMTLEEYQRERMEIAV